MPTTVYLFECKSMWKNVKFGKKESNKIKTAVCNDASQMRLQQKVDELWKDAGQAMTNESVCVCVCVCVCVFLKSLVMLHESI